MVKNYAEPMMEVTMFDVADVITTSTAVSSKPSSELPEDEF